MHCKRLYWLALLLGSLYLAAPAALAQQVPTPERYEVTAKDADDSLEDSWFGIYFQSKKIGYEHTVRSKVTEAGKTFYREKSVMLLKLQSMDQKSEIKVVETIDYDAKPPFKMIRADFVHQDDKITHRIKLLAKGKSYEAEFITNGVSEKKMVDLDFNLTDLLTTDVWLKKGPKLGDKITTRSMNLEDLRVELVTTKLIQVKETLHRGVKLKFFEVESFSHKSKTTTVSLVDADAHTISSQLEGFFETRRESEADAKNTEFSADVFVLGMVKIDQPIGSTRKVKSLIVEIKGKEATALPNGPHQTLVHKGGDIYELRIGKEYGKKAKATPEELKEGLEETTAYLIKDVKVKALVNEAIGDAKTDREKVKNICKFVHDFIEPSLDGTSPRIQDLVVRRKGDCKSYALLFTTLARAAGIPSREVSGFVYMGDDYKAFGGHAWNEVVLDGYWVPIDASMNSVDLDAAHICLGVDRDSSGSMLKTYGKLSLKLVEVKTK